MAGSVPDDASHLLTIVVRAKDLIRISVGTEHIDDIIQDFEQSFKVSSAAKAEAQTEPQNAEKTGDTSTDAKMTI